MVAKSRRKNRKLSKSGKTRQRRRYSQKRRRIYKKKGGKRGNKTKGETCKTKKFGSECVKGLECTKGEDGSLKCQPKTKKKNKGHCEPCKKKTIGSQCKNELECINFKCQWKDRKKRKDNPCNKCIEIPQ